MEFWFNNIRYAVDIMLMTETDEKKLQVFQEKSVKENKNKGIIFRCQEIECKERPKCKLPI